MTPQEKAKELVQKFEAIRWHDAKKCALIAVDEIIVHEKNHVHHKWVEYWQQVKEEIEKL